jgi:Zn-finger nucleic acid-binding protein
MDGEQLICALCDVPLVPSKVSFKYMGHDFYHELPACPRCGQVYISEELVKGKISEVETNLEDK